MIALFFTLFSFYACILAFIRFRSCGSHAEEQECRSFSFSMAILNGTFFVSSRVYTTYWRKFRHAYIPHVGGISPRVYTTYGRKFRHIPHMGGGFAIEHTWEEVSPYNRHGRKFRHIPHMRGSFAIYHTWKEVSPYVTHGRKFRNAYIPHICGSFTTRIYHIREEVSPHTTDERKFRLIPHMGLGRKFHILPHMGGSFATRMYHILEEVPPRVYIPHGRKFRNAYIPEMGGSFATRILYTTYYLLLFLKQSQQCKVERE